MKLSHRWVTDTPSVVESTVVAREALTCEPVCKGALIASRVIASNDLLADVTVEAASGRGASAFGPRVVSFGQDGSDETRKVAAGKIAGLPKDHAVTNSYFPTSG